MAPLERKNPDGRFRLCNCFDLDRCTVVRGYLFSCNGLFEGFFNSRWRRTRAKLFPERLCRIARARHRRRGCRGFGSLRDIVMILREPFPQGLRFLAALRRSRRYAGNLPDGLNALRCTGRKQYLQCVEGNACLRTVFLFEALQHRLRPLFAQKRFNKLRGDFTIPGRGKHLDERIE